MINSFRKKYLVTGIIFTSILITFACIKYYTSNKQFNDTINTLQTVVNEQDDQIKELQENAGKDKRKILDTNYKLFFGEWIVTKIVGEDERCGKGENAESMLGTVFYYDYDVIKQNGEIISNNPMYKYFVLPKSNREFLYPMPTAFELGIEGEFHLYVETYTEDVFIEGTSFYVKDDNTLVLFSEREKAFYEMKRKSYIRENISENYSHI